MRRESISSAFEKYRTVSRIRNNFQIPHNRSTGWLITKFRVFAISRTRSFSSNIKISDQFIEMKYQYDIHNKRVVFITNNRQFFVFKTVWYRRLNCIASKYAGKIDEIDTLIYKRNLYMVSYVILRVSVRTKNMLSVTSSKESCLIEVMFSIIEFISFIIQLSKGSNAKGR